MEKILITWVEDMQQQEIPISLMLIQEKALSLFQDLKRTNGDSANNYTFTASHTWFEKFKGRSKLHNIKIMGEAASADTEGAKIYQVSNSLSIYQIFNVDETGLYWKKMPDRSYISQQEKSLPGFVSKDRLTFLLGGNASGDCKISNHL
ncbi:Tigger transposable element-derived protein 1 [Anthophora plagiata]